MLRRCRVCQKCGGAHAASLMLLSEPTPRGKRLAFPGEKFLKAYYFDGFQSHSLYSENGDSKKILGLFNQYRRDCWEYKLAGREPSDLTEDEILEVSDAVAERMDECRRAFIYGFYGVYEKVRGGFLDKRDPSVQSGEVVFSHKHVSSISERPWRVESLKALNKLGFSDEELHIIRRDPPVSLWLMK